MPSKPGNFAATPAVKVSVTLLAPGVDLEEFSRITEALKGAGPKPLVAAILSLVPAELRSRIRPVDELLEAGFAIGPPVNTEELAEEELEAVPVAPAATVHGGAAGYL